MKKVYLLIVINAIVINLMAQNITLTSSPVAASNIAQGTSSNIVYIVKMDVASLPVTVNSIQFTLTGTHIATDLTVLHVYFNATAPTISGASFVAANVPATFAAPHTYNTSFNAGSKTIAAGASGYFIITVNTDVAATDGKTIKVNGAAGPVTFGYTTAPTITNDQTDIAGTQTIGSALPLTLTGFTAKLMITHEVQLQWMSAAEFNTKDFEVEWSDDGQSFSKITVLPAAGNSSENLHYGYLHAQPVIGNNYYRLKMIDIDGRFTYSQVIKINIAIISAKIGVFPNPVINLLQLQVQAVKSETIIFHLLSGDGKIIASKSFTVIKGSNQLSWNLQQLAAGNYLISSGNNHFETIKIIKR